MKSRLFCLVLIGIFYSTFSFGQVYELTDEMSLEITGTSTLHDWKVSVSKISGLPSIINIDSTLSAFTFEANVKSMDGGRGASMNGKIYKALKSDDHPKVIYTQTGNAHFLRTAATIEITSNGVLSIAGANKEISLRISGEDNDENLFLKGVCPLKMSDFGIDPPSAMFGQIETDDKVIVAFSVKYKKQ